MRLVTAMTRLRAAAERRRAVLAHRGDTVLCPVCGHGFDRFRSDWNRSGALCWRCGSHERHRALWLFLESRPELLLDASSLLHFAPEWCLERRLREVAGLRYTSADLAPNTAELQLDITDLRLPDGSFDAIICSHVLEHVEDDRAAMRELHRVLVPGGWAIVLVPLDLTRAATYEDPDVSSPQEREREFWQFDHVRLYASDIADRLRAVGFEVTTSQPACELGLTQAARYGLLESDVIHLCRRRQPREDADASVSADRGGEEPRA
jgi:SAM-dependent methyltransferase